MSTFDFLDGLPSVVTSVAAIVALRIAWLGLSTWKDQIKWNTDVDLAKRILEALYRHGTALKKVRFPAIYPQEQDDAVKGKQGPNEQFARRYFEIASVYEVRWNNVIAARRELQPLIFEAQVIWDSDFRMIFEPIWKLEDELFKVVRIYLESMNPDYSQEIKAEFAIMRTQERNILYFTDEVSDVFNSDYEKTLQPLMSTLRAKLGRR